MNPQLNIRPKEQHCQKVQDGLLFIPDISGFTNFVSSTDMLTGKLILQELLLTIIENNEMELCVSEIEGDAVLFYRLGTAPSFTQIYNQFKVMSEPFEKKRRELEARFLEPLDISLKVIAHYGPLVDLQVGPFKKLYGEVVVQAHELLKNQISSKNYLLLSNALIEAAGGNSADDGIEKPEMRLHSVKDKRPVKYAYFDLPSKKEIRVA